MGQNASTVEAFYAAMGRGDIPFVIGALDPTIVWNEAENFVYADRSPYVGVDAVLTGLFARLGGEWDGFSAVPHEIVDGGNPVIRGLGAQYRLHSLGFLGRFHLLSHGQASRRQQGYND